MEELIFGPRNMKMKTSFNPLIILVIGLVLFSHCKKAVTNIDSYTSFGRAYPINGNQNIYGAQKSPDGGYLIWGSTDAGTQGKQDGFLMRLDKNYNQLWYKTYGGVGIDYFQSAALDGQGNILAAGTSTSFGVSLDSNSYTPGPCIYAVYVNGNGELLWQKTYYGNPGAPHFSDALNKVLLLPNQNFALIGSTNNFTKIIGASTLVVAPHAFIQCINKQGDTLWSSHYDYDSTNVSLPSNPLISSHAGNATLSPDGNIEMLMVTIDTNRVDFVMSLIKITPDSAGGYNNYISRKLIQGSFRSIFYPSIYEKAFFPMQLANESSENYFIAAQSEIILSSSDGTMLKREVLNEGSIIDDLLVSNGSAWFASNRNLIKTDLNGTIIWDNSSYEKLKIDKVKGIFIEKDSSISVFCSYKNAVGENDIAILRFEQNGQLILK
jgi:hypothetical protein